MEYLILIGIFLTHLIADFVFQSHEMAQNKSKKLSVLAQHCGIHLICFMWVGWKFAILNALLHAVIDWNIWRGYKMYISRKYEKENEEIDRENEVLLKAHHMLKIGSPPTLRERRRPEDYEFWADHWFYTTIGFDQFLHATGYLFLFWLLGGIGW